MAKFLLKRFLPLLLALALPLYAAVAAVEVLEFSSAENRERYHDLVEELRCPKCQNQNLAGSDSPIAKDLRRELHRLLEDGRSDSEIKQFMVARYGDYVLYRPPVQDNTLLLWWGPPAVLGIGILVLLILIWRRRRLLQRDGEQTLSEEDRARLDALLQQDEHESDPTQPDGSPR